MLKHTCTAALLLFLFSCTGNPPTVQRTSSAPLSAGDKIEIAEVAATFDNSLDKESLAPFLGTFAPEGSLRIAGKKYQGREALEGIFHYMLDNFARGKRHCVSNHIITGTGDSASMESYLSVINRNTLDRGGSAIQHDEFKRIDGAWKIHSRVIDIDSSFFAHK